MVFRWYLDQSHLFLSHFTADIEQHFYDEVEIITGLTQIEDLLRDWEMFRYVDTNRGRGCLDRNRINDCL